MSTAILISGQLRTFARCYPTQRWHVLRHFDDPHFFLTVSKYCGAEDYTLLVTEYGADRVHTQFLDDPDLSPHLTPELTKAYHLAPYANAAPAHQLLLQHWYQNECWKFYRSFSPDAKRRDESSVGLAKEDDTVIRLRGDLWFHSCDLPHPCYPRPDACLTPWWGKFGGINDRFAIMGPVAARYYFTVWEAIPELLAAGCPFHPESLVAANLERGNCSISRSLAAEFSTLRMDGNVRPPEIAPWDLAHAALRAA